MDPSWKLKSKTNLSSFQMQRKYGTDGSHGAVSFSDTESCITQASMKFLTQTLQAFSVIQSVLLSAQHRR